MGPIRGQTQPLPVAAGIVPNTQHVNARFNTNMHNRFDIEVVDAMTGAVKRRAQAENVVCNTYWTNCMCSNYATACCVHYGSGSGAPSVSDTALFSELNKINITNSWTTIVNETETLFAFQNHVAIDETTSNGSTITEIGLGYSNTTIYTHALLKDANGNNISIQKTATDIINIYITFYLRISDTNGYAALGYTPGDSTAPKYYRDNFLEAILGLKRFIYFDSLEVGLAFYDISGISSGAFPVTDTTWPTSAKKEISIPSVRLPASALNGHGGVNKVRLCFGSPSYSYYLWWDFTVPASWYTGSDIIGEAVGTGDGTMTAFATDFVHATNATVYVNGVATPAVTVTDAATVMNNIVFTTAPASGAVITADYHTSVIAKDANHVFDFTCAINFGEYTE